MRLGLLPTKLPAVLMYNKSATADSRNTMETVLAVVQSPVCKSFLAGSLSGTCSTILFQPLDLLKTRVQTTRRIGVKPDDLFGIIRNVLQQENVAGLWRGTAPSMARCVPGVGLYFASLHTIKSNFGSSSPSNSELLATGAGARCLAGVAMLPFTVIKVRIESGRFNYGGMRKGLMTIWRTEGARGLYSGLTATLSRDAPFSGLYLLFYTNAKAVIPNDLVGSAHLALLHFSCGIVAGAMASIVTQPADVVKTHMQMNPQEFKRVYVTAASIYKTSGLVGFMSGIVPRTLRRTLMAALAWTVYEQITRKLGLK